MMLEQANNCLQPLALLEKINLDIFIELNILYFNVSCKSLRNILNVLSVISGILPGNA